VVLPCTEPPGLPTTQRSRRRGLRATPCAALELADEEAELRLGASPAQASQRPATGAGRWRVYGLWASGTAGKLPDHLGTLCCGGSEHMGPCPLQSVARARGAMLVRGAMCRPPQPHRVQTVHLMQGSAGLRCWGESYLPSGSLERLPLPALGRTNPAQARPMSSSGAVGPRKPMGLMRMARYGQQIAIERLGPGRQPGWHTRRRCPDGAAGLRRGSAVYRPPRCHGLSECSPGH